MGYEITYFFHERQEDGKYNTTERKEVKKKVGATLEDVPLERLAATIMSQLARRDIWVVDVEIHEFSRKPLSFKESQDGSGIILKGKKFSLDKTTALIEQVDVEEVAPVQPSVSVKPTNGATVNLAVSPIDQKRILLWVYYEPDAHLEEGRRLGLKFTVGKRYPVHRMTENPRGGQFGSLYSLTDDLKRVVQVDEKFFVNAGTGLIGDNEVEGGFSQPRRQAEPRLSYDKELRIEGGNVPERRAPPVDLRNIPVDDGGVPPDLYKVPDIRPGRKF